MNPFSYTPLTGSAHWEEVSTEPGSFIAGGTNLLDLWKYNLVNPAHLYDLKGLNSYRDVVPTETGGLRLGALVTNADTAWHPLVEQKYPLLSKAILAGASAQIRNMATNGGNLMQRTRCHYFYDQHSPCNKRVPGSGCPAKTGQNRMHAILGTSEDCIAVFPSDMCVALAALEAIVIVKSIAGERRIAFEDFHRLPGDEPEWDNTLQPGEMIIAIELPEKGFAANYSYLKIRDRASYAFALVSVATALELEGDQIREARIALGGVAHKPWRVKAAEEFLVGLRAIEANFAAAADIILDGAVGFGQNTFKIDLAKRAIIRNGQMALKPETQRPGAKP